MENYSRTINENNEIINKNTDNIRLDTMVSKNKYLYKY